MYPIRPSLLAFILLIVVGFLYNYQFLTCSSHRDTINTFFIHHHHAVENLEERNGKNTLALSILKTNKALKYLLKFLE